ncbi:MAG: thioesterase family protein [Jatrophihabitans sp.]
MARFVHEIAMRWSDMDAYGHINNVRYLTYLEEGRIALFQHRRADLTGRRVIARHEIDYRREIHYRSDPPLRLEMWIDQIRGASFIIRCEIVDGDVVAARAASTCVAITENGRPRRLDDDERAVLGEYADDAS